jgi:hypothetical protein
MRTKILLTIGLLCLAFLLPGGGKAVQAGNSYLITIWTTAGGGSSLSASGYQFTGTIGQAEAGHDFTAGAYAFHGGFWHPAGNLKVFVPMVKK